MSNPYHGEVSQQNKAGGKGHSTPGGHAANPKLNMKTAGWGSLPGKASGGWAPKSIGHRVQTYAKSKGV